MKDQYAERIARALEKIARELEEIKKELDFIGTNMPQS